MTTLDKLNGLFNLSHRVAITVPNTTDINTIIDNTVYVETVAEKFSAWFGGASAQSIKGYWVSDAEGLVKEEPIIVYSYCSEEDLEAHITQVLEVCRDLKGTLSQDAIALEVDNTMYFI